MAGDSTSKPDDKREKARSRGVKKALLGPVNLSVAGAAAVGAAALGSLPLLALGGAAYAALVAWDLSSPSFWRKVVAADGAGAGRRELPRPREVFDAETRAALERVHGARASIAAAVAEAPGPLAESLASLLHTLDELDQRVGRLVARSDELSRYLARADELALHAEIGDLADRARRAPDAEARRHYEEARAAREEQLRTLADIAAARERLVANLTQIVATLEGVPARLMKMRALDAQAADDLSGDVGRELTEMNVGLQAFEETLRSLVQEPA
jgi:hypothetical protein